MMQDKNLVRERQAMLAGMTPVLRDGSYFFCSTDDADIITAAATGSLAIFREDEGTAFVLNETDASKHGFDISMPMCRIVLEVFSALDGVGLTAAVATALAEEGVPCNIISAYHHDNVFVPELMGRQAMQILEDVQRTAAEGAI